MKFWVVFYKHNMQYTTCVCLPQKVWPNYSPIPQNIKIMEINLHTICHKQANQQISIFNFGAFFFCYWQARYMPAFYLFLWARSHWANQIGFNFSGLWRSLIVGTWAIWKLKNEDFFNNNNWTLYLDNIIPYFKTNFNSFQ